MHPCDLTDEQLLAECDTIRQRRSGPGGQHRNKVETAIRLTHKPTGITGQASERRSQADNLREAIFRLRLELALQTRTQRPNREISTLWQSRTQGGKITVNPTHADFPKLLAELLDQLAESGWDHKQVGARMSISGSQLLKLLKLEPRAFQMLNGQRQQAGLSWLK